MTCRKQHTKESILMQDKGEVSGDTWARAGLVSVSVEGRMAGAAGPPQLGPAGEETHWKAHSCAAITLAKTYDTHTIISRAQIAAICKTTIWGFISALALVWLLGFWVCGHTHTQMTWFHNCGKQFVSNVFCSLENFVIWKAYLTFQIFAVMWFSL